MQLRSGLLLIVAGALVPAAVSEATEPSGIESNVLLAHGPTARLKEHISVGDWTLSLEVSGGSEFYFQDLVIKPGGRSGWHSHPGLLLITIKDGSVDWYDKDCGKRSYTAGQSFTEGAEAHNVVNSAAGNARLLIAYIVKSGDPRRREDPQPRCAAALQLR
jgi:quercetin dioxygenase-like cupin family protein